MAAPDYDWEMDRGLEAAVSCISLGSYCAVAAALNHLKLRSAAYPFDWNRTTMEGVIHFLETKFENFLSFLSVKDFPGGKHTGGKAYCGAHHSVWHEDLATEDGTLKYQRRISRFYENGAPKLLFIRCMNTSSELMSSQVLLRVLQSLFPKSHVYLLLIAVCQPETRSVAVDSTSGRLLVHCTPQWSVDGLLYAEPIRAAYAHAAQPMREGGGESFPSRPMHEVLQLVLPYFGGLPQQVPFSPQLLYVPQCPFSWLVAAPQVGPLVPLPAVPVPAQVICRPALPPAAQVLPALPPAAAPVQVVVRDGAEERQRLRPAQALRAVGVPPGALALPPRVVQYTIAPQVHRLAPCAVGAF